MEKKGIGRQSKVISHYLCCTPLLPPIKNKAVSATATASTFIIDRHIHKYSILLINDNLGNMRDAGMNQTFLYDEQNSGLNQK